MIFVFSFVFVFVFAFVFLSVFVSVCVFVFIFVFHFCSADYLYMLLSIEPLALSAMGKKRKTISGQGVNILRKKYFPLKLLL